MEEFEPPFCDRVSVDFACCSGITITVAVALEAEKLLEEWEDELLEAAAAEACGAVLVRELASKAGEFSFAFVDALELAAIIIHF